MHTLCRACSVCCWGRSANSSGPPSQRACARGRAGRRAGRPLAALPTRWLHTAHTGTLLRAQGRCHRPPPLPHGEHTVGALWYSARSPPSRHAHLRVVDVGCSRVVVPRLVVAAPSPLGVVVADGGRIPGQAAAKLVPLAVAALLVRTAVVDHNVGNDLEPHIMAGADTLAQVAITADASEAFRRGGASVQSVNSGGPLRE